MSLGLAIPLVIAFGLVLGTGSYIFYELIQYLNEKPPASQTLLDKVYNHHFKAIIIRNVVLGIIHCTVNIGIQLPSYVTMPLGWSGYGMNIVVGIHLFVCLLVKIIIIYKPELIEEVSDDNFSFWSW